MHFDVTASIDEGSVATTAVLTGDLGTACDDADAEAANSGFTYSIDSSTPAAGTTDFDIDVNTGDITVNSGVTLDYETTPTYTLIIFLTATGGIPLFTGTATVIVDVNGNDIQCVTLRNVITMIEKG